MSGIKIGSNIDSLTAQRYLGTASARLSQSSEKLSSGLRINKASDDAAGLAISSSLKADVRVNQQAIRNVNDGISMANIAEGALSALKDITYRQRELATQAANGTYTLIQRQAMNEEANTLVDEYNRVVQSASLNGIALFEGNSQGIRIQAGEGVDGSLVLGIGDELARNVGDGTFQPSITLSSNGTTSVSAMVGDINGDGKADILSASYSRTINIFLGKGNGTFQANAPVSTSIWLESATLSDVNGDGVLDIVAGGTYTSNEIAVLLGKGDGTFQAERTFTMPSGAAIAFSSLVTDINGDDKADIITSNGANGIGVFAGNGDGTFGTSYVITDPDNPRSLISGDVDGDGKTDLIALENTSVGVFLGNGDGTFQSKRSLSTGVGHPSVLSEDVNGDGRLDVIAAGSRQVNVFLGNGDGTFQRMAVFSTVGRTNALAIADFNGDGLLDVTYTDDSSGGVGVLIGNGDGIFQSARFYSGPTFGLYVATGDFNSDGRFDIVNAGYGTIGVSIANGGRTSATQHLNLNTRQGALDAMSVIDGNLQRIENELGSIGAVTSRFAVALNTLQARGENETAASSRITDTDTAEESAALVRTQILQQSASAVLAQANLQPALVLKLLQ